MLLLKTCTCGCAMHIYKHGSGPYVNLTPETAKYIKYGIIVWWLLKIGIYYRNKYWKYYILIKNYNNLVLIKI